jgi:N-acetylmuramoyl-L-alanine amidase
MHSRIDVLIRFVLLTALLLAVLVAVGSRLADADRPTAAQTDASSTSSATTAALVAQTQSGPELGATPATPARQATETLIAPSPTQTPESNTPSATVLLPATPTPSQPIAKHIGILAGHWGYDSGAICADGLREVDITTDIARRVADQLRALGYTVDILREQQPGQAQPPLQNFEAAAFLSLHADSCVGVSRTGFKVARWAYSTMPDVEDRLVDCIYTEYGRATGLPRHDDSITIDMWNYYAFREIARATPGAILELGFMTLDRELLVQRPDEVAEGVVNGLRCFLESPVAD